MSSRVFLIVGTITCSSICPIPSEFLLCRRPAPVLPSSGRYNVRAACRSAPACASWVSRPSLPSPQPPWERVSDAHGGFTSLRCTFPSVRFSFQQTGCASRRRLISYPPSMCWGCGPFPGKIDFLIKAKLKICTSFFLFCTVFLSE